MAILVDTSFNREVVLVMGATGLGKSSLIQLFTNDEVRRRQNGSHDSTTREADEKFYQDNSNNSRWWLDTVGFKDSRGVTSDDEIKMKILQKFHDNHIKKLKIIWINQHNTTVDAELKSMAAFINIFVNQPESELESEDESEDESDANLTQVSNSIMVIIKEPTPIQYRTYYDGRLINTAYSIAYGRIHHNDNLRLIHFGYTCIDWLISEEEKQLILQQDIDIRQRDGYYTISEIKNKVNNLLNNLQSYEINFRIQTCQQCNITGDSRFLNSVCNHPRKRHHNSLTRHAGSSVIGHIGSLGSKYHPSSLRYFHSQGLDGRRYHPQGAVYKGWFLNYDHRYPCCGWWVDSQGCTQNHMCCNQRNGSTGCQAVFACCNHSPNHIGCEQNWSCCNNLSGHSGCTSICDRCRRAWSSSPCENYCGGCQRATTSIGCVIVNTEHAFA